MPEKGTHLEKAPTIRPCGCTHPAQDKWYGAGKRVHNPTAEGWRCTVCATEKKVT